MQAALKNFFMLVVVVFVGAAGFWYVTRAPEQGLDHIEIGRGQATSSNPADEFAMLLNSLSGVDFQSNNTIFNDEVFKYGLVSFRRDLPTIERSRQNPFAPLEGNPAAYIKYGNGKNIVTASSAPAAPNSFLASSSASTSTKKTN